MKFSNFIKSAFLLLAVTFLFSCSGSGEINRFNRNVRYFFSTIRSIDRNIVTLSDGSVWKTNRLMIAVNLAEVLVVLEESVPVGYLYINNTKYDIRPVSSNDQAVPLNYGYMDQITTVDTSANTFSLSNGTRWLTTKANIEMIAKWQSTPDVIISLDKTTVINPKKMEYAKIAEITSSESTKEK